MDFAQQLGRRIRHARMECGMTQSELANEARVGANYVPRLERGELVPSVEAAYRIAKALGLSLDEICGRSTMQKDVQEVIGRLGRADTIALRRVADVIDELTAPLRRSVRGSARKAK